VVPTSVNNRHCWACFYCSTVVPTSVNNRHCWACCYCSQWYQHLSITDTGTTVHWQCNTLLCTRTHKHQSWSITKPPNHCSLFNTTQTPFICIQQQTETTVHQQYHSSLKPFMEHWENGIKMGDHERLKPHTTFLTLEIPLYIKTLYS
jgi:hypothetical protein